HPSVVHDDGPADDRRIALETPAPILVADHGDRRGARKAVLAAAEHAASPRRHFEHGEIVVRHEASLRMLELAAGGTDQGVHAANGPGGGDSTEASAMS